MSKKKLWGFFELQYSLTYYWYYLPMHKIQTFNSICYSKSACNNDICTDPK